MWAFFENTACHVSVGRCRFTTLCAQAEFRISAEYLHFQDTATLTMFMDRHLDEWVRVSSIGQDGCCPGQQSFLLAFTTDVLCDKSDAWDEHLSMPAYLEASPTGFSNAHLVVITQTMVNSVISRLFLASSVYIPHCLWCWSDKLDQQQEIKNIWGWGMDGWMGGSLLHLEPKHLQVSRCKVSPLSKLILLAVLISSKQKAVVIQR